MLKLIIKWYLYLGMVFGNCVRPGFYKIIDQNLPLSIRFVYFTLVDLGWIDGSNYIFKNEKDHLPGIIS